VLNDDRANVRGGLYRRYPWFGTDAHDPIPLAYSKNHRATILRVGKSPDRVWHFWSASPRVGLPPGHLEGCTVKARVRISRGALLQMGMDYWRNPTIGYGSGGNHHEAGACDWYLPSNDWQDAVFTDIRHHCLCGSDTLVLLSSCPTPLTFEFEFVFDFQTAVLLSIGMKPGQNLQVFVGQECPTRTSL
jgi:hypothetical protein